MKQTFEECIFWEKNLKLKSMCSENEMQWRQFKICAINPFPLNARIPGYSPHSPRCWCQFPRQWSTWVRSRQQHVGRGWSVPRPTAETPGGFSRSDSSSSSRSGQARTSCPWRSSSCSGRTRQDSHWLDMLPTVSGHPSRICLSPSHDWLGSIIWGDPAK